MKKLLSALLAICMVCMFAVPVFADANDDYIAAVKASAGDRRQRSRLHGRCQCLLQAG